MGKSPIKFGLGEYSDKPFTLKSGNKPGFKMMGASKSPVEMSARSWRKNEKMREEEDEAPLLEKVDWGKAPANNTQERIDWYKKNNLALDDTTKLKGDNGGNGNNGDIKENTSSVDTIKNNAKNPPPSGNDGEGNKWKNFLKKTSKIALAGLTGGLDAVYGSGKILPEGMRFYDKKKKNPDDETPEERATRLASRKKTVSKTTYI